MVLRAKEPKRSAISSCAGPKTRRKSLARNLPNLLAAIAVIAFTDASKTARCYHLAKKLKGGRRWLVGTQPKHLPTSEVVLARQLVLALFGHADVVAGCPRKTSAHGEYFRV